MKFSLSIKSLLMKNNLKKNYKNFNNGNKSKKLQVNILDIYLLMTKRKNRKLWKIICLTENSY